MTHDPYETHGFVPGATLPVLPLRDIVVFPHMIVPLFVGREKSINALEEVMRDDSQILLVTQKNAGDNDPEADDIYTVGTIASVLQLLKLPDGTVKVLVEGASRAKIARFIEREEFFEAEAEIIPEDEGDPVEIEALARSVVNEFENYVKLNKKVSPEVLGAVSQIEDYAKLADTVASHLAIKISEKQEILEMPSVAARLEQVLGLMESEISVLQVEKRIRSRVKRQMEKTQREYYLNEQMKAIQKELGEGEDGKDELAEIEERIVELYKGHEPGDHMRNFFESVDSREQPISDVVTHHRTMTSCHMCNIALMLGRELNWDPQQETFIGDDQAVALMSRKSREGYVAYA